MGDIVAQEVIGLCVRGKMVRSNPGAILGRCGDRVQSLCPTGCSAIIVIPAQAGIHLRTSRLRTIVDSRLRGNDGIGTAEAILVGVEIIAIA